MLIQEHVIEWRTHFLSIKKELENTLFGLDLNIEHVGSTSVLGLASKPIIDVDIIYKEDSEFEKIKTRLSSIGYFHNGNQGIPEREVFKRNQAVQNKILDNLAHHLYVCPKDSKELQRHLQFRNHLRNNEAAKLRYQNLKYELAKKANQNKKTYTTLKEIFATEFINSIIDQEKKT
ncbi:GrpB family protein [uncultured Aquimarina sp.]|uniref:GrpB family protein n=1 Tax=uncultured Aquimarina sp. TaxID=575652 RepID=UPI002633962A|nr:GrpB family protein [uncultured Aquimarina sp.]